jgi:hypothetical protein
VGGVAGYALFDWQHKSAQTDAYRQGVSAEQRKDWDKAGESFAQAGDWHDATQRKETAAHKVKERDRLYGEALAAESRSDFLGAVSDLQKVQAIQPAYRDTDRRLASAREQALNHGLDGIIYLVQEGENPGLYIRDELGQAHLLPGSDRNSAVHAISTANKAFVYDRPSEELDYLASGLRDDAMARDPLRQGRGDRVPVLAGLSKSGVLTVIALPELDSAGMGVFAARGLWWYSSQPSKGSFGYETFFLSDYLPFSQDVVRVSDLQAGKRVAAVDPQRSRVVMAEVAGEARSSVRKTYLYLADARGHDGRLLQTVDGDVVDASVSSDGRWLLYSARQDSAAISKALYVLSLEEKQGTGGASPSPRLLDTLSWSGMPLSAHLSGGFLPADDAGQIRVVVSRSEESVESLRVFNLDNGQTDFSWSGQTDGIVRTGLTVMSSDGKFLAYRRQDGNDFTLQFLNLQTVPAGKSQATLRAFPGTEARVQISPGADYVIASLFSPDGISRSIEQAVYSFRISDDGKPGSGLLVAKPTLPYMEEYPALAMPPGGYLLAYVNTAKELRAVGYGGDGDTLVARGVGAVWSLWLDGGLIGWK